MKYITFSIRDAGDPRLGVVDGDRVIDVRAIDHGAPSSLFDLIRDGQATWQRVAERVKTFKSGGPSSTGSQGHTHDLRAIFPVDTLIESLSRGLTLETGDIIATGTPDGVGFARTPPEFLQDGDIMETEVEGIGIMRNRVVAIS